MLGRWFISNQGVLNRCNSGYDKRRLNIIHVDDHLTFHKGLVECIKPFFPKAKVKHIPDGTVALKFIEDEIDNENLIDLIITDINHPGLRGDEMIKKIRYYEDLFKLSPIPIIVLTMMGKENLNHIFAPEINLVTKYLAKASDVDEIIEAMENILF